MSSVPDPAAQSEPVEEPGTTEPVTAVVPPADAHRLAFIDQIRAAAALYVALYHAVLVLWPNGGPRPPWYLRWADFGHVGVSIFIVLSGYSLALGMARKGRTSVGSYWT